MKELEPDSTALWRAMHVELDLAEDEDWQARPDMAPISPVPLRPAP